MRARLKKPQFFLRTYSYILGGEKKRQNYYDMAAITMFVECLSDSSSLDECGLWCLSELSSSP